MSKKPWLTDEELRLVVDKEELVDDGDDKEEEETPEPISVEVGELGKEDEDVKGRNMVRTPSGGALLTSGPRAPSPSIGRPTNRIREAMSRTLEEALPELQYLLARDDLTVNERLKIMDFLAKYGLGVVKSDMAGGPTIKAKVLLLPDLDS